MAINEFETRRIRLLQIRKDFCGGSSAELASRINRAHTIISRMLMPEGKEGKKNITEAMRDLIEQSFSLHKYWLDGESTIESCELQSGVLPLYCQLNRSQQQMVIALIKPLISDSKTYPANKLDASTQEPVKIKH